MKYKVEVLKEGYWVAGAGKRTSTEEEAAKLATFRTRRGAADQIECLRLLHVIFGHKRVEYRIVEVK